MSIPETTIQNILSASDIVEVIEGYIRLSKTGRNFKARCPFHNEKTPSFIVNPEKQIFHCFGCNAGGNAIGFVMQMEGLTYPEAIRKLGNKYHIEIKETYSGVEDNLSKERETIYRILEDAGSFFQKHLSKNNTVKNWLKKRGLNDEFIEKFRIGYAPKSSKTLLKAASEKGYSKEVLYKSGIISTDNDFFYDRVIFPIFDVTGRIVAFGGRALSDTVQPKYLNSPETIVYSKSKILYGLNFAGKSIRDNNSATILEGYVDVIMCHQYGLTNTVATLGTALASQHSTVLKRYSENIIVAYDPDTAGRSSAIRSCEVLLGDDLYVKVAELPEGKDSDEILISGGADKLKKVFLNSKSYIDFLIDQKAGSYDVDTIEGKRGLLKLTLPVISKIPNAVVKSEYIKILSERLKIKEEIINLEIKKVKQPVSRINTEAPKPKQVDEISIEERNLILVLAGDIKLLDYLPENLNFGSGNIEIKKIFDVLYSLRKENRDSVTSAELVDLTGSNFISNILTAYDFNPTDPKKYVQSYADAISLNSQRKKLGEMRGDNIREFMELSKKLKGSRRC